MKPRAVAHASRDKTPHGGECVFRDCRAAIEMAMLRHSKKTEKL